MEEFVGEYRDRWDKLETYKCNPNSQIELLNFSVRQIQLPHLKNEITNSYDMRTKRITYHLMSESQISAILPAFSFLRMFDEVGLPFRCGICCMYSDTVIDSSMWIAPYAPLWALSSMIRTGNDKGIKEWFDQIHVALLSSEEVNLFYELFTNSLKQATNYLELNPRECCIGSYSVNQI
jgi:hypothetical protein